MKMPNLCVLLLTAIFNTPINSQNLPAIDSLTIVEKAYVHVDRDSYYPGDNIWFKAYLVDASDRLLSNHSSNLHIELISPASKIINSRIIRLNEGLGNGDFHLPENLQSGRYSLRAYTNYMRNFGDELFFKKDITIINSSDANKMLFDSIKYIKNKIEIIFSPESGSLVDNVSSNVAFKAVNALGAGCDVSDEIHSSTGEILTTFKSTHKGMGKFSMNPVPGIHYYAITKNNFGDTVRSEIPRSFSKGIVLSISKTQGNGLPVIIKTNAKTLSLVYDHDLSLTVSARNIPLKTITFRMKSLINYYTLPIDDLPGGIIMLTISGLDKLPLCERLAFVQNNKDIKIKVEPNKKVYKQRDYVSVKISISDSS
jgi:hypothetical protein